MTNLTASHWTASHFDKKQRLCPAPAERSYVEQPHSTNYCPKLVKTPTYTAVFSKYKHEKP